MRSPFFRPLLAAALGALAGAGGHVPEIAPSLLPLMALRHNAGLGSQASRKGVYRAAMKAKTLHRSKRARIRAGKHFLGVAVKSDPFEPLHRVPTRYDRRVALGRTRKAIVTGQWPAWERVTFPKGTVGPSGWPYEITTAYRNGIYAVQVRPLDTGHIHLAISMVTGGEPPWRDLQRIKNDLVGADRVALQVYPAQGDVVDGADMYHLWILPAGEKLPFGLHREVTW